jgi:hypothetical protein
VVSVVLLDNSDEDEQFSSPNDENIKEQTEIRFNEEVAWNTQSPKQKTQLASTSSPSLLNSAKVGRKRMNHDISQIAFGGIVSPPAEQRSVYYKTNKKNNKITPKPF